jgi:hypothetical protein
MGAPTFFAMVELAGTEFATAVVASRVVAIVDGLGVAAASEVFGVASANDDNGDDDDDDDDDDDGSCSIGPELDSGRFASLVRVDS